MDYLKDIETPDKLPFLLLKCVEHNYTITFTSDYEKIKKYQGKNAYIRDIKKGDKEENIKTFYRFVISYNNLIFHIDVDYLLTGCLYKETNNTSLIGKTFDIRYKKPYAKSQRIYTTTEVKENTNDDRRITKPEPTYAASSITSNTSIQSEVAAGRVETADAREHKLEKRKQQVAEGNGVCGKATTKNRQHTKGDFNMTKALDNWKNIIEQHPPTTNAEKRVDTAVSGSLNAFYNANPSLFEGTNIKCPLKDKYKLAKNLSFYLSGLDTNSVRYKFIKKLIDAAEGNKPEIKQQEIVNEETDADKVDFDDNDRKEVSK